MHPSPNSKLTLNPDELHVWIFQGGADGELAPSLRTVLTAEERSLAARFHRVIDRQQFELSRVLLRFTLSQYFAVLPSQWRFAKDRCGKPFVTGPQGLPPVQFSLSHTDGLIACLVSSTRKAAVDVEKDEWHDELFAAAQNILSPVELEDLTSCVVKERAKRFLVYWTLKEAYVKARGDELSLPLKHVSFEFSPMNEIRAVFGCQLESDPTAWMFWCWAFSKQHTIAIAAKRDNPGPLRLVVNLLGPQIEGCCRSPKKMIKGISKSPDNGAVKPPVEPGLSSLWLLEG